jgi:hypothetical protein
MSGIHLKDNPETQAELPFVDPFAAEDPARS